MCCGFCWTILLQFKVEVNEEKVIFMSFYMLGIMSGTFGDGLRARC